MEVVLALALRFFLIRGIILTKDKKKESQNEAKVEVNEVKKKIFSYSKTMRLMKM